MTNAFIELVAQHSIYVTVDPSHTSIILQVADVGVNRFIKKTNEREYTASLIAASLTRRKVDNIERIGCVVRTVRSLSMEKRLISNCFQKCGLFSGYSELFTHFPPALFNAGALNRDLNLPQANPDYVKPVLSLTNLAAERGLAVQIPDAIISEHQKRL